MNLLLRLLAAYAERFLSAHVYSFQTFSVLEVLASSKMNQVEFNVRDHVHGQANVGFQFQRLQMLPVSLTDVATLTMDLSSGHVFTVTVSGGAAGRRDVAKPLNLSSGCWFTCDVIYANSGGNRLVWDGPTFKFPGGVACDSGQLTTSSGGRDKFSFHSRDGSTVDTTLLKGMASSGQVS